MPRTLWFAAGFAAVTGTVRSLAAAVHFSAASLAAAVPLAKHPAIQTFAVFQVSSAPPVDPAAVDVAVAVVLPEAQLPQQRQRKGRWHVAAAAAATGAAPAAVATPVQKEEREGVATAEA